MPPSGPPREKAMTPSCEVPTGCGPRVGPRARTASATPAVATIRAKADATSRWFLRRRLRWATRRSNDSGSGSSWSRSCSRTDLSSLIPLLQVGLEGGSPLGREGSDCGGANPKHLSRLLGRHVKELGQDHGRPLPRSQRPQSPDEGLTLNDPIEGILGAGRHDHTPCCANCSAEAIAVDVEGGPVEVSARVRMRLHTVPVLPQLEKGLLH